MNAILETLFKNLFLVKGPISCPYIGYPIKCGLLFMYMTR